MTVMLNVLLETTIDLKQMAKGKDFCAPDVVLLSTYALL